jgi:hypothetical protein
MINSAGCRCRNFAKVKHSTWFNDAAEFGDRVPYLLCIGQQQKNRIANYDVCCLGWNWKLILNDSPQHLQVRAFCLKSLSFFLRRQYANAHSATGEVKKGSIPTANIHQNMIREEINLRKDVSGHTSGIFPIRPATAEVCHLA